MKIYLLYGRGEALMTLGHTLAASIEDAARNFNGAVEKYDLARPEQITEQLGGSLAVRWDDCGKFMPTPETAAQVVDGLLRQNPVFMVIAAQNGESLESLRQDMVANFIKEFEPFHIGQGLAVAPKEA